MEKKFLLAMQVIVIILIIIIVALLFLQQQTNTNSTNNQIDNNYTMLDTNVISDSNMENTISSDNNQNNNIGTIVTDSTKETPTEICGNNICEQNEITSGSCPKDCE